MNIALVNEDRVSGTLFLDPQRLKHLTRLRPSVISITRYFAPDRELIESYIAQSYQRSYGAHIEAHYPFLMSVRDDAGRPLAAVGFRPASSGRLFLESYLPEPVEQAMLTATGANVDRDGIVEIGNLVSEGRGASIFLFVALAAYLRQQRFIHACATATSRLRSAFGFFGIEPVGLGAADPETLPDRGRSWGSYYTTAPKVVAGAIAPAFERLERLLPSERNADLDPMFARIHYPTETAS